MLDYVKVKDALGLISIMFVNYNTFFLLLNNLTIFPTITHRDGYTRKIFVVPKMSALSVQFDIITRLYLEYFLFYHATLSKTVECDRVLY